MNSSQLTHNGTVPARKDCPFRSRCEIAAGGHCLQKGPSQGASVLTLVTDPQSFSLLQKLPKAGRFVELLDRVIAEVMASGQGPVDGFIELNQVHLFQLGENEGLSMQDMQFGLNLLGREAFNFGGRDASGNWMDQDAVMTILRGSVRKDPEAVKAAATSFPIVRIAAYQATEFSCAIARGFDQVHTSA